MEWLISQQPDHAPGIVDADHLARVGVHAASFIEVTARSHTAG